MKWLFDHKVTKLKIYLRNVAYLIEFNLFPLYFFYDLTLVFSEVRGSQYSCLNAYQTILSTIRIFKPNFHYSLTIFIDHHHHHVIVDECQCYYYAFVDYLQWFFCILMINEIQVVPGIRIIPSCQNPTSLYGSWQLWHPPIQLENSLVLDGTNRFGWCVVDTALS